MVLTFRLYCAAGTGANLAADGIGSHAYFSAGTVSAGVLSAGSSFSVGLFSAGFVSVGLFGSVGIFSIGFFSVGVFSIGITSIAHIALGFWVYGRYSFRFRQATRLFLTNYGPLSTTDA